MAPCLLVISVVTNGKFDRQFQINCQRALLVSVSVRLMPLWFHVKYSKVTIHFGSPCIYQWVFVIVFYNLGKIRFINFFFPPFFEHMVMSKLLYLSILSITFLCMSKLLTNYLWNCSLNWNNSISIFKLETGAIHNFFIYKNFLILYLF